MTLVDRLGIFEGFSEIPRDGGLQKLEVLNVYRLVQSPALFGLGDFRCVGFFAQEQAALGRPARRE